MWTVKSKIKVPAGSVSGECSLFVLQMTTFSLCPHTVEREPFSVSSDKGTNPSILKSRDINLLTENLIVKVIVFPVVMYRCESWTIKKAECQRMDVFELWCWRRLLRVPWTARRSNQSILKEINPEFSFKGLMLKLQL